MDVNGVNRSSGFAYFAKSLATFAFRDLFNAKERKGFRKGRQSTLLPHCSNPQFLIQYLPKVMVRRILFSWSTSVAKIAAPRSYRIRTSAARAVRPSNPSPSHQRCRQHCSTKECCGRTRNAWNHELRLKPGKLRMSGRIVPRRLRFLPCRLPRRLELPGVGRSLSSSWS